MYRCVVICVLVLFLFGFVEFFCSCWKVANGLNLGGICAMREKIGWVVSGKVREVWLDVGGE